MAGRQTDRLYERFLSRDNIKLLVDMVNIACETTDFRGTADQIFDILLKMHDYRAAWIFMQDESSGRVSLTMQKGLHPSLEAAENQEDFADCIVNFVLTTGQAIALRDTIGCKRLQRVGTDDFHGVNSHISVPIRLGWRTVGVLNIGSSIKRNFPTPEIQFLAMVAGVLSLSLKAERARTVSPAEDVAGEGLRRLVEKMTDGILLMERDSTVTLINPKGRVFLEDFSEIEKGEFFDRFGRMQAQIMEEISADPEKLKEFEIGLAPPGGKIIRISAIPMNWTSAGVETVIMVVKDVTQEKILARREWMDARVATFGPLLEGLSHELNNPLAAVSGYLQMLMRKCGKDFNVMAVATKMESELKRAILMVQNLISMKKIDRSRRTRVEVERIVMGLFEEFRPIFERCSIQAAFAAPRGLPPVLVDVEKITQVFRNIIVNGVQKMEEDRKGGTLDIAVQAKEGYVQVFFNDSGPKFFSSKRLFGYAPTLREDLPVKDMELSLAFCYAVVQEHGGLLYTQTEGGVLAGFVVELPIAGPTD